MVDTIDCIVIGAGVIGLATARACAQSGRETIVLEAAHAIGTETSSRNSEVIHAGIYYPKDSLKAQLCVQGKHLLYEYCSTHSIPYQNCGKLIVATHQDQLFTLQHIATAAAANGAGKLRWINQQQAQAIEPALHCVAALESPTTGIIDSHALMLALLADLESAGGMLALQSPVIGGQALNQGEGVLLHVGGDEPTELLARCVINCAGLQAQAVSASIRGIPPDSIPTLHYAKGSYYSLSGKSPFSRLIYPVPESGGLGVHLTLDLGHQARFGPDVQWVDTVDYTVDPNRAQGFYTAIRRYWPALPDHALQPAYAGIRPKLSGPTLESADFVIQGADKHGVHGLVNLYGIESPGLTAALAIAQKVTALLP